MFLRSGAGVTAAAAIADMPKLGHANGLGRGGIIGSYDETSEVGSVKRPINAALRPLLDAAYNRAEERRCSRVNGFDADIYSLNLPIGTLIRMQREREQDEESVLEKLRKQVWG